MAENYVLISYLVSRQLKRARTFPAFMLMSRLQWHSFFLFCSFTGKQLCFMDINKLYDRAYAWLFTFGPKLVIGVILLFVGWWLTNKAVRLLNHSLTKRRIDPTLRPFMLSFINIFLKILLALAILQILGIQLTIFAAVVGSFGVAAGLALSGTLQNFTSGILILLLKPFRAGDNIIAQGQEGTVAFIRIFYTVVTTFDNRTVIIPNSKLSNEVIINLSREGKRRLDIELKFNFAIPFEQVKSILEQTINANNNLLKEPTFRIGVSTVDADGYKVMVNAWVKPHGFQDVKLELQQKIVQDLITGGIKLPGL
jgi:small conductance mechanosensitive channel